MLPMRPGVGAQQTHDGKRNGTTTLFAARQLATGRSPTAATTGTSTVESRDFLTLVATTHPGVQLHVVCDDATRKHPKVKAWLAKNPWVTMHVT